MNDMKLSSIVIKSKAPLKAYNTVEEAFIIMKKQAISSIIIADDNNRPIGIFTEYDALKIIADGSDKEKKLIDFMTHGVFYVQEDTYIHDAYMLMEQKNFRHIIVVDENEVYLGVVTEGDFLRHMGFEEVAKIKSIEDAMSEAILTISSNISLSQAAKLMSEKRCDYAIILDKHHPIGIINERDITHYYSDKSEIGSELISALAQHPMQLVKKSTSLEKASLMMKEHGIHQLIVIDNDENLIGLITRHDILKAVHGAYFGFLLQTIETKTSNEQELIRHKEELERLANYDILTNLPNRLLFKTYLKKSIANAIHHGHIIAIVILNLDRFKDINDSYGHNVGDELLKTMAERLLNRVREGDVVARLGGDEFALILEHIEHEEDIARVLKEVLKEISFICKLSNGIEVQINSSAGIVLAPKNGKNVEALFQYADSALHQAKSDGRGMYRYYTDAMTKRAQQKIVYENKLRHALRKGELEVYYQPQVHIQTGKIVGAEALLRWNDPKEGIIPPSLFIPIAEESGLINSIGEWVLNEVCKQGKIWLNQGYHLSLAVNVSANQIKYQNIPEIVSNALQNSGFEAQKLELELTESAMMQREDDVVTILHALKAIGVRLAIDDFGTGYSSLSYLKRFPIDVLKIDKSFIDDIPYEKDDMAIVVAIIEMGKALDYQILAEGIEYKEQLDFLKEKNCTLYQGYLKSKALQVADFEKLIQEQNK